MKSFSQALLTSFSANVSTIAKCARIERRDGVIYRFTSLDKNLIIDGEEYISSYAFNPTAYSSGLGLQIENMEIAGALDTLNITSIDIAKGLFYGAQVWFFSVDYKNLAAGKNKILFGTTGEIEFTDKEFLLEVRGSAKKYDTHYAQYYGKVCRARLGDSRCGVDLNLPSYKLSGSVNLDSSQNTVVQATYVKLKLRTHLPEYPVKMFKIDFLDSLDNLIDIKYIEFTNSSEPIYCPNDSTVNYITNIVDDDDTNYICLLAYLYYLKTEIIIKFSTATSFAKLRITDANGTNKINGVEAFRSLNGYTFYTIPLVNTDPYRNGAIITIPYNTILDNNGTNRYRFFSNDVANFSKKIDNYFQYGYVTWTSGLNKGLETEVIESTTDGKIELALPMPYDIEDGDTFDMYVGCNHLLFTKDDEIYNKPTLIQKEKKKVTSSKEINWQELDETGVGHPPKEKEKEYVVPKYGTTTATGHCKTKFNNVINFRGEPYLPNEDVLLSGYIAVKESRENADSEEGPISLEPVT